MTYLVCLFECSVLFTANPVIPVYTVDVVSRILADWGLANICCLCCRALLLQPLCLPVNVTSIMASTGVWDAASFRNECLFTLSAKRLGCITLSRSLCVKEGVGTAFLFLRQQQCSSGNLTSYIMAHRRNNENVCSLVI